MSSQDQSKYTSKLANTNVLITGGSSGLGFALAEALLEQSPPPSNIIISSSNAKRVETAIQRLKSSYPNATQHTKLTGLTCNLGDEDTLEANIAKLFHDLPLSSNEKLHHLVHTAGDPLASIAIGKADLAFIKKAGMVRFFAPLLLAKHAVPYLAPGLGSSITITSGGVADHPIPDWTVVGSYASGLQGMTRGLALDLKPIRVNLVQPGGVDTELWDHSAPRGSEKREELLKGLASHCATGRVGLPEDVVEGYLMCLRDRNLTGSIVKSDGGHAVM